MEATVKARWLLIVGLAAVGCATTHYPQGEYKLLMPSSVPYGLEVLAKGLTFEDCRYDTGSGTNFPTLLAVTNTMIDQHEDGEGIANLRVEITQQYRGLMYNCLRATGDVVRFKGKPE